VLLAPPLLAVIYAHRAARRAEERSPGTGEQQFSSQSAGIILPPQKSKDDLPSNER